MNLHAIVAGAVGAVNPLITALVYLSTGSTTAGDGARTPTYAAPVSASMQMQSLSYNDIQHLDGLNIQGNRQAVYLNGNWSGLVRPDRKGGDIMVINGQVWLVAVVLESWPGWTKVAVTLQNDAPPA